VNRPRSSPLWRIGALAVCAAVLSCGGGSAQRPRSLLNGAFDLVHSGEFIFVTSSDRNELQALDLRLREGQSRAEFFPAPNPLQTLVIPVVDEPTNLARDVRFAGATEAQPGSEVVGPYVYARSSGRAEISIVAATRPPEPPATPTTPEERWGLREVCRLRTGAPVTAFAARAGVESTLYYAVQTPAGEPRLRVVRLPTNPDELRALCPPAPTDPSAAPLTDLADRTQELAALTVGTTLLTGAVTDLLVMPEAAPGVERLVVATRSGLGRSGQTALFEMAVGADGARTVLPTSSKLLDFGPTPAAGQPAAAPTPVRLLATNPRVSGADAGGTQRALLEGERIFAVVEESACVGRTDCAVGVVAVDTASGRRAVRPGDGLEMTPVGAGNTLATGLALAPGAALGRLGGAEDLTLGLAGIVPTSSGRTFVFDALGLTGVAGNTATPSETRYFFSADTDVATLAAYRLPGPVVTVGSAVYIAYPGANGILQVDLAAVVPGAENSAALFVFE
jgi:hypothetical protein